MHVAGAHGESNALLLKCPPMSKPDGGVVSVQFPKHGKKSVDIREGIIYVTIEQYFGLLKTQVEQVDLTQLQTEKIKNDKQGMTDVNGPSQVSN